MVLHSLKPGDGTAELAAVSCIGDGEVEDSLHCAEHLDRPRKGTPLMQIKIVCA